MNAASDIIDAINETPIPSPFVVLIDSREQMPFTFQGFRCGASRSYRPIDVRWEWECLGHFMGDYSLRHYKGLISIERKSIEDFQSTVLGWPHREQQQDGTTIEVGRRINFEKELANLNAMKFAAVVVEGTLDEVLATVPQYGKHTSEDNAKFIRGFVLSWKHTYNRIHWEFCQDRRAAEVVTFDHLRKFWEKQIQIARRYHHPRRKFRGKIL